MKYSPVTYWKRSSSIEGNLSKRICRQVSSPSAMLFHHQLSPQCNQRLECFKENESSCMETHIVVSLVKTLYRPSNLYSKLIGINHNQVQDIRKNLKTTTNRPRSIYLSNRPQVSVVYLTIILRARVGYEMIDSQRGT